METASKSKLFISVAEPDQQAESLDLVFAGQPLALRQQIIQTTLMAVQRGEVALDGLFVATRDNRIVGAAWCQELTGRVAAVWPAQVVDGESPSLARELMVVLRQHFLTLDVHLAQAVLADSQFADAELLKATGFVRTTDLLFLVSRLESFPHGPPQTELQYESVQGSSWPRLAQVIGQSYSDTLDCPALNGVRNIDDVLEGYRHVGSFDPRNWFLIRHDDDDVGCLLLNDHPSLQQYELVYMGLVPHARGHGWGWQITRRAQWLTRRAGRCQLTLAVDLLNRPALNVYGTAGFEICDHRSVYFLRIPQR